MILVTWQWPRSLHGGNPEEGLTLIYHLLCTDHGSRDDGCRDRHPRYKVCVVFVYSLSRLRTDNAIIP